MYSRSSCFLFMCYALNQEKRREEKPSYKVGAIKVDKVLSIWPQKSMIRVESCCLFLPLPQSFILCIYCCHTEVLPLALAWL
mmetsp:Transcript_26813/g.38051  ORF Transcript_26813/g.38051 Transcript_26813/m.38051 type:complete len:82 (+) Transcript_26813:781-1026(+)